MDDRILKIRIKRRLLPVKQIVDENVKTVRRGDTNSFQGVNDVGELPPLLGLHAVESERPLGQKGGLGWQTASFGAAVSRRLFEGSACVTVEMQGCGQITEHPVRVPFWLKWWVGDSEHLSLSGGP